MKSYRVTVTLTVQAEDEREAMINFAERIETGAYDATDYEAYELANRN